jgi:hypothetical protein
VGAAAAVTAVGQPVCKQQEKIEMLHSKPESEAIINAIKVTDINDKDVI